MTDTAYEKKISIIIPAYNAASCLPTALDSVLNQTFSLEEMEVIVVDDGSADETAVLARSYLTRNESMVRVISLDEPSGSPAKPRNIGLSHAKGEYVFFLDADDWLAPQAVEKMIAHADEWNSDVLLVKLIGEGGRDVPKSMFFANQPSVDVFKSNVMWTFGPMKLFRRSLLVENDISFPDYMPEDITFTLKAYLKADVVSVASDYDYYHYLLYDTEKQCSFSTWDNLDSNYQAMSEIFGIVSCEIGKGRNVNVLLKRLFRRDICRMLVSACRQNDDKMLCRIRDLTEQYYSQEIAKSMAIPERVILDCAFEYGFDSVNRIAGLYPDRIASLGSVKPIHGVLSWFFNVHDCELCIPICETGGFSAIVTSVDVSAGNRRLELHGILSVPAYLSGMELEFAMVAEEMRGRPRIEYQCSTVPVSSNGNKKSDSISYRWVSKVDMEALRKVFPLGIPPRRRDFLGKKTWALSLKICLDARLVKKVRAALYLAPLLVRPQSGLNLRVEGFSNVSIGATGYGGLVLYTAR